MDVDNALYPTRPRVEALMADDSGEPGGDIASLVIGDVQDLWDTCLLVEYRSAAAFAEIGVHRAAGLDGQLLIRLTQCPW